MAPEMAEGMKMRPAAMEARADVPALLPTKAQTVRKILAFVPMIHL